MLREVFFNQGYKEIPEEFANKVVDNLRQVETEATATVE
jgi:hypothetical protein